MLSQIEPKTLTEAIALQATTITAIICGRLSQSTPNIQKDEYEVIYFYPRQSTASAYLKDQIAAGINAYSAAQDMVKYYRGYLERFKTAEELCPAKRWGVDENSLFSLIKINKDYEQFIGSFNDLRIAMDILCPERPHFLSNEINSCLFRMLDLEPGLVINHNAIIINKPIRSPRSDLYIWADFKAPDRYTLAELVAQTKFYDSSEMFMFLNSMKQRFGITLENSYDS